MTKLYKRKGVYYGDIYINGKRIRPALSKDRRFAEEKFADLIKVREATKYGHAVVNPSWDTFRTQYMAYSKTKNYNTHKQDKAAFKSLESAFPLARLEQLTPQLLESFKGSLKLSGNAVTTQNRRLRSIKAAINKAIEWKMMEPDMGYRKVRYYKEAKGRLEYFGSVEVAKLMKVCRGVWLTIFMLGYYAGLRREEIYALRAQSVDFTRNRIHIEPYEGFTPKDYERRFIPMHPELRNYLKQVVNDQEFVLGSDRPSLAVISAYFAKLIRKAKLEGGLHKLRHTFGSMAAMGHIDIPVLQKWMGHSNIKTTMIYAHLSDDSLSAEINKIPSVSL